MGCYLLFNIEFLQRTFASEIRGCWNAEVEMSGGKDYVILGALPNAFVEIKTGRYLEGKASFDIVLA